MAAEDLDPEDWPCFPGVIGSMRCFGWLEVDDVNLSTPAWGVKADSILNLWFPDAFRGENDILPGVAGRLPYPLRLEQGDYSLRMFLTGVVDKDGNVAAPDQYQQLQANVAYLRANLLDPPGAPVATRVATLHMPDGSTVTANVQFPFPLRIDQGDNSESNRRGVLILRVPPGVLA